MDTITPTEKAEFSTKEVKEIRKELQDIINKLQSHQGSRELSLSITKLQEGKIWLGMELGRIGGEDLNAIRDAKELG